MNSLNPMMKVGEQLRDTVRAHRMSDCGHARRPYSQRARIGGYANVMDAYPTS